MMKSITIVRSYTGKNITHLLPLALLLLLRTCNNTDGNKFVIFSSVASYYGGNSIVVRMSPPITEVLHYSTSND